MTTSREQIERCLTRVRAAGIALPQSTTADSFRLMIGLWHDKLRDREPRAVEAAFERYLEEHDRWPLPKHILPLVDAEMARLGHRPQLPRPEPARNDARAKAPTTDHASIRETCMLLEAIRAQPHLRIAAPALLRWGELLIARHIEAGRAPDDVARWYEHLPAKYREQLEVERAA